jgi:hypothetical protein
MLQKFINQAVKLPALLDRFDKIRDLADPSSLAETTQLWNDFRNFIESVRQWESDLTSEEPLPLYWVKSTYMESPITTKDILWYPDIMTANSLTHCWAFEIIARTQLAALERSTTDTKGSGLCYEDSHPDLHTASESSEQRSIAALAEMVFDSMPYLLQSEFKLYGPGSAFFTLPTAMRVFQDEPNRYRLQIVRCQAIIDHLASIGVFFPRT